MKTILEQRKIALSLGKKVFVISSNKTQEERFVISFNKEHLEKKYQKWSIRKASPKEVFNYLNIEQDTKLIPKKLSLKEKLTFFKYLRKKMFIGISLATNEKRVVYGFKSFEKAKLSYNNWKVVKLTFWNILYYIFLKK